VSTSTVVSSGGVGKPPSMPAGDVRRSSQSRQPTITPAASSAPTRASMT